jgi:hypothetical protein
MMTVVMIVKSDNDQARSAAYVRFKDNNIYTCVQPLPKKVEAIKNMVRPTTHVKKLRRFIGMVNYYRDMWVRRSELLALLTSMTSKNVKFNWTDEHQKAFENIKKIICREVMLDFRDFSKPFHIYTDASDKQLGAVITQDEKTYCSS